MGNGVGRVASDQALAVPATPANAVGGPSGFDPSRKPTHYCVVCAARWIKWPDGNWTLQSEDCGPCCDNVSMDAAPIVEFQPDGSITASDHERVKGAWDRAQRQAAVNRYRGIQCAICDEPFERHSGDWGCPRRVVPRFKFPAIAIEARSGETGTGSTEGESAGPKDIARDTDRPNGGVK